MNRAAATVLLLAGAALAEDPPAFVELTAPRDTVYLGERVPLRLRFGLHREFFAARATPLFLRSFDLPVQVVAAALAGLPPKEPRPTGGRTFALNDQEGVAVAAGERGPYSVYELTRNYPATSPGDVVIPAPALRYAHASRFEEDLVGGRTPVDPRTDEIPGAELRLRVLPLPAEGRPPEFADAVGRFTISAALERNPARVGDVVRLTLRIEGEGNLREIPAPRLDGLAGFHVYGVAEQEGARGPRTIVYDIAPLDANLAGLPAIRFGFFDPGPPPGYRTVATTPIPFELEISREPTPPTDEPGGRPWLPIAAGVAALALLAIRLRRRRAPELDRDAARRRAAAEALARAGPPELADAFAEVVAAHLGCPRAAVIGPRLAGRLERAGVPSELAARVAAALEALVAARYGGRAAVDENVQGLAAALQAAPRGRGSSWET